MINTVSVNKDNGTHTIIIPQDVANNEEDNLVTFERKAIHKRRLQYAKATPSQTHGPVKRVRKCPPRMKEFSKKKKEKSFKIKMVKPMTHADD